MKQALKYFQDGTHRALNPSKTLVRVEQHLDAMGITRIANVTGLDRIGIPVVNATRPNSKSLSVSQGKGLTLDAAKASATMEAIEGYHAENIISDIKTATYTEMRHSYKVCDVSNLAFLKDTKFDPDKKSQWICGINLLTNTEIWVPYETVHTDYTLPRKPEAGCFVASTNGLASGNHLLEAQIHGICEVIERDSNTLWEHLSFQEKDGSYINLSTVEDSACESVIEKLHAAEMEVAVWNMTSDIGIPTFYCLILDKKFENGHSGAGAGTHPVKEVALLRSLTEAVQVRTNYITGARDDLEHNEYSIEGIAQKNRYARKLIYSDRSKQQNFQSIPHFHFNTFEEDLEMLLEQLKKVGIQEVISVDLTKPEFDIAVTRMIIPGLEGPHDHNDYCMGQRAIQKRRRYL